MTKQHSISIPLSNADLVEFGELARQYNTSMARLGELAIRQLVVSAKAGAVPMLPKVDLDKIKSEPLCYRTILDTTGPV